MMENYDDETLILEILKNMNEQKRAAFIRKLIKTFNCPFRKTRGQSATEIQLWLDRFWEERVEG